VNHRLQTWLPTLVAVAALIIFAGTLFPYLVSPRDVAVGYLPMLLGLVLFALLVGSCTHFLGNGRWLSVCIAVVASSIAFSLIFIFVVLIVLGS
jgi:hypothetical protein